MNGLTVKNKLGSGHAFNTAESILANLEPEIAICVPKNVLKSIAGHVAHMAWWQRQALTNIRNGTRQPQEGNEFPQTIALEQWQMVLEDFFVGLEALKQHCDNETLLGQAYLGGEETIADLLLDFALHNAYHLGQIVLLRRLQGAWKET